MPIGVRVIGLRDVVRARRSVPATVCLRRASTELRRRAVAHQRLRWIISSSRRRVSECTDPRGCSSTPALPETDYPDHVAIVRNAKPSTKFRLAVGDAEVPATQSDIDGGEEQQMHAIAVSVSQNLTGQASERWRPKAILSGREYRSR